MGNHASVGRSWAKPERRVAGVSDTSLRSKGDGRRHQRTRMGVFGILGVAAITSVFASTAEHNSEALRDTRVVVDFPEPIKIVMLERMRRNLSDVYEIQKALASSDYDRVVEIAEYSLGLSSLGPHNARQAPYMPAEMQRLGRAMHAASSRLATVAAEADAHKALQVLSDVTGLCVACHAIYRAK